MGDLNLYYGQDKDDDNVQLFYDSGFKETESLKGKDTNASQTEAYDRLFFRDNNYFKLEKVKEIVDGKETEKEVGGVFNPFEYVYKIGQEMTYKESMKGDYTGSKDLNVLSNLQKYYKHPWRKNQLSDHFPIWTELIIDSSDDFLKEKLTEL